jgi:hypothetical protein
MAEDFSEVIALLENGEGKSAFHKLGEKLHGEKAVTDAGNVHTLDEGSGNNTPPPPPPPTKNPPTHG